MATRYTSRARPRSHATLKAEALLVRYPDLSEQELTSLIEIFPTLPILDRGLMTADERLARNLAAFDRDHGSKLHGSGTTLLWMLAFPATVAITAIWWLLA